MKLTAVLLAVMVTASLAQQSNVTKEQAGLPSIVRAPLHHLGFAWNEVGKWTEQAVDGVKGELNKVDLSRPGKWFTQAGHSIGAWMRHTGGNVKAEVDKIEYQVGKKIWLWTYQALLNIIKAKVDRIIPGPNKCIHSAARYVQLAIRGMSSKGFAGWLKQATKELGIQSALHELQYVKLEELPKEAWQYIKENPRQILSIVLALMPAVSVQNYSTQARKHIWAELCQLEPGSHISQAQELQDMAWKYIMVSPTLAW
ncbi:hypothetical protein LTR17_020674 [Elasticomyces elasticus]|nr:hypothetical protein LTR17_020674 [Elasticomyces elasticus]